MPTATASPSVAPSGCGAGRSGGLWFVGALPPPLNGQSGCNAAMLQELERRGARIRLHDIGGTSTRKLRVMLRAVMALLLRGRRRDHAYLSVPGQAGVWLFVPLALVLRLRGIEHWIHHHSFRPINLGPMAAMRMLVAAGGAQQRHILLSDAMHRRFADLYLDADDGRAATLSNAYLFGPQLAVGSRPARPVTLGHMSVLTRDKGVSYLLALFAALLERGQDWRLVVAGPCADAGLAAELAGAQARHPGRIDVRGAVHGADKERFFADIDLFVLPSTLVDEAEPLVMLEAYGRGVDVVASDTGCIRDRIRPGGLLCLDLVADAVAVEERIAGNAVDWHVARSACVSHARAAKAKADAQAARLLPRLLGSAGRFAIGTGPVT